MATDDAALRFSDIRPLAVLSEVFVLINVMFFVVVCLFCFMPTQATKEYFQLVLYLSVLQLEPAINHTGRPQR